MPVQLSSEEELPETAVKARKRPFMKAVKIVSDIYIYIFFHIASSSPRAGNNYYIYIATMGYWACAEKHPVLRAIG